jgi:hypothetical protein
MVKVRNHIRLIRLKDFDGSESVFPPGSCNVFRQVERIRINVEEVKKFFRFICNELSPDVTFWSVKIAVPG